MFLTGVNILTDLVVFSPADLFPQQPVEASTELVAHSLDHLGLMCYLAPVVSRQGCPPHWDH